MTPEQERQAFSALLDDSYDEGYVQAMHDRIGIELWRTFDIHDRKPC